MREKLLAIRHWFFKKVLTWEIVRIIGELRILTRVSYISLLFVPLLATFWSGVEKKRKDFNDSKYNYYEQFVTTGEKYSIKTSTQLKQLEISNPSLKNEIDAVSSTFEEAARMLNDLKMKYNLIENKKTPLDVLWLRVFLASFLVGFGHLIYQMFCPKHIQRFTIEEFQDEKKSLFSRYGTSSDLAKAEDKLNSVEANELINYYTKAEHQLKSLYNLSPTKQKENISKKQFSDVYAIRNCLNLKDDRSENQDRILKYAIQIIGKVTPTDIDLINLNSIGSAAEYDYKKDSYDRQGAILLSASLYTLGIIFLVLIIISQFKLVFSVAEVDYKNVYKLFKGY